MTNDNYKLQLDPSVKQVAKAFGYQNLELINPRKPIAATIAAMKPDFRTRTKKRIVRLRDRVIRTMYQKLKASRAARK